MLQTTFDACFYRATLAIQKWKKQWKRDEVVLGIQVDEDVFDFAERPVEWNEFEVHLPTCSEDERLQRIQLWLVYSEIIQGVGRARLVNNEVGVHVFAKLPVSGARLSA